MARTKQAPNSKRKKKVRGSQETQEVASTLMNMAAAVSPEPPAKKARSSSRHPALSPTSPDAGAAGPSSSRKATPARRRTPSQEPMLTVMALDLGHKTGMLLHTTVKLSNLEDDKWNKSLQAFNIDLDRVTHDGNNHTFDSGVKVLFGPRDGSGSRFEFGLEGDSKWSNRDSFLLYGLKSLVGVDDLDQVDDKLVSYIKQCGRGKFDILQDEEGGLYLQDNHNAKSAPLYVDDAVEVVIQTLLEDLQEQLNRKVKRERGDKVVFLLTVPVTMSARRRNCYVEAVKEALEEHGGEAMKGVHMEIIEEQHASLIAMLRGEQIDLDSMDPCKILTLDVGSTTTDASVVGVSAEGGKLHLRVEMSRGTNVGGSMVTSEFRSQLMEEMKDRGDGNDPLDATVFYNPAVMDLGKIRGITATARQARTFCPYAAEVANLAEHRCNVKDIPISVIEEPIKKFEEAFKAHLQEVKVRLGLMSEPDRVIMVGGATKAKGRYNLQAAVEEIFPTATLRTSDLGKAAEGAIRYYLTKKVFDFDHQRLPNHIGMHVQDLQNQQILSIAFNKHNTTFPRDQDAIHVHWPHLYTDEMVEAEDIEIETAATKGINPQRFKFYQPITLIECRSKTKTAQDVVEGTRIKDIQIVAYHQLQVWCENDKPGQNIQFFLQLDRNYGFVAKSGEVDVPHQFHMRVGHKPPGLLAVGDKKDKAAGKKKAKAVGKE